MSRDIGGRAVHLPGLSYLDFLLLTFLPISDWAMHSDPAPAHPSYRLITTLRLYHLFPLSSDTIPPNAEEKLEDWRNTTFGKQDIISEANEALWRATLTGICKNIIQDAQIGMMSIGKIDIGDVPTLPEWAGSVKSFVEMLRKEEYDVCKLVIESLEKNEQF